MDIYSRSKRNSTIFRLKIFVVYYLMFGIDYLRVKNLIYLTKRFNWQIIDAKNIQHSLQDNSKRI